MNTQHTPVLMRVGAVLLVIGLIDVAIMIYCIANRVAYSSSFNIFAIVAGIFLLRGNLRAASIVRWQAVVMLSFFVAMMIVWPFTQPLALTLTQFRLDPGKSSIAFLFMAFVLGLLIWLIRELGCESVMAARANAGKKQRDMRIPAAAGVGLAIALGIVMVISLGGETADRAKFLAEKQVGPGYRLQVSSLSVTTNNRGTVVSGVVTVWNDNEIRNLTVHWEEP